MSVFLAIAVMAIVAVLGLVTDGGAKIQATTTAVNAAQEAARAAGQALSGRAQQGGTVDLATSTAAGNARAYLAAAGVPGEVSIAGTTVTVNTTVTAPTKFLGALGIHQVVGHGQAQAVPETGATP